MKLSMDRAGRLVIPRSMRDALGLPEGGPVDATLYGEGIQLVPGGRTARLRETSSGLVADSQTVVDDETVFALIDSGRR